MHEKVRAEPCQYTSTIPRWLSPYQIGKSSSRALTLILAILYFYERIRGGNLCCVNVDPYTDSPRALLMVDYLHC